MSNPENNRPFAVWRERVTTPFRNLYQEGFLSTWHNHTLFSLVSLSLLAFAAVAGLWWFGLRESPDPIVDPVVKTTPADIEKQLQADEEEWARIQEIGRCQEEIALANYRLLCVRQLADRTKDAVDECRDEAVEWAEDMKDFESASIDWSEPSNEALLSRVDMLMSLDTPDKYDADNLLDRHKTLMAPLQRADSLGEAVPISSTLETSIEDLATTARDMKELLRRRRAMLASIVDSVKTSSREDLPAFSVALETYRSELAAEQQKWIDSQMAEARAESEAVLLQVEREAEAALTEAKQRAAEIMGQIEAQQAEGEAQRAKQLQDLADAEAQLIVDREKLEREFEMDLPDIKHYLQAFITPENHHPTKSKTAEKIPFPYSYIVSCGALASNNDAMSKFCYIATEEVGKRPRGPIPYVESESDWDYYTSKEELKNAATAQGLMRKYGLLMVEKKMLLP